MTRLPRALLAAALLLILAACTGGGSGGATTTSPPPTGPRVERKGPPPAPAGSAEAAVRSHLEALQRGDTAAAFLLLSDESFVAGLADEADWARRRSELAPLTGFSIDGSSGDKVRATLRHQPGLDSFRGLSPAEERAVFVVRKEHGGFLVDAEPTTEPVLPSDESAVAATKAWAERVQACDEPGARALEAVAPLFVSGTAGPTLCKAAGAVTVGSVGRLDAGPASQDIVGQYSTDALVWARVVPVLTPVRLLVILAPLGNEWKVLGLTEK